jgi:hypothetical protein
MIAVWGDNGSDWVGRSMSLYCDPTVRFGGVALGGIRISHMSHIERDHTLMLTTTRGKRAGFTVKPLAVKPPSYSALIEKYKGLDDESRADAWGKLNQQQKNAVKNAMS